LRVKKSAIRKNWPFTRKIRLTHHSRKKSNAKMTQSNALPWKEWGVLFGVHSGHSQKKKEDVKKAPRRR